MVSFDETESYDFRLQLSEAQMRGIAGLFGIPVYESRFLDPGRVLMISNTAADYYFPNAEIRYTSGNEILDYIREKANLLRERLGLELVDYATEDSSRDWQRRYRITAMPFVADPRAITQFGTTIA